MERAEKCACTPLKIVFVLSNLFCKEQLKRHEETAKLLGNLVHLLPETLFALRPKTLIISQGFTSP